MVAPSGQLFQENKLRWQSLKFCYEPFTLQTIQSSTTLVLTHALKDN